jgi:signal transduction histidine kinase
VSHAPPLSLFILGTALLALAVSVWRARPGSPVNRRFGLQTAFLALWVFGITGLQGTSHLEAWGRLTFASAIMIAPAFLVFTRAFPAVAGWPHHALVRVLVVTGIVLAVLSLATPLLLMDVSIGSRGLERRTGLLYPIYPIYFLTTWAVGAAVFVTQWRRARSLARAQLQYVGTGIGIAAVGGITFNLLLPWIAGSSQYNWLGPYFTLAFAALVAHAIIRHRLMDLRPIIHRGLAYTVVTGVLSVSVIGATRFVLPGIYNASTGLNIFLIVGSALLLLTSPAQRLLKKAIDPYFYRGRVDHESALRAAMHRLAHLMEPATFAQHLRDIFRETLVPDSFTLLIPSTDESFECLASDLSPEVLDRVKSQLILFRNNNSTGFVTMLAAEPPTSPGIQALLSLGIEVLVILRRRGDIVGVALLGQRRSGDPYYAKDLAFVEALTELAAIALENTLLYRQRIHILEYSERLLESLDSAVIATDTSGRVTSHNPAAARLFHLAAAARDLNLGALPSDIGWAMSLAVRDHFLAREVEVRIDHPTRGTVPAILSTAVLRGDDRDIVGALAIVTDLSTVKALEQNQRRLEHLSLMARFYAGIAHEIRNPLAAISNFIAMLPDRFDDPEYREIASRLLPLEVGRITALSDRLRLMAPGVGGTLGPVNVRPIMLDIMAIHAPAAQDSNVRIVLRCPEILPLIAADPNQLIQLFVNLIRNAIEAMSEGGTIVFEATLARFSQEATLMIRIIDEGLGIAPEARARIFEPFFTTKSKGSGLGLAICREIVDFHGAQLTLKARDDSPGTVAEVQFRCIAIPARSHSFRIGSFDVSSQS